MKTLRAFLVAATSLVGYTTMAQMWGNTLAIGDEVCVEGYLMVRTIDCLILLLVCYCYWFLHDNGDVYWSCLGECVPVYEYFL